MDQLQTIENFLEKFRPFQSYDIEGTCYSIKSKQHIHDKKEQQQMLQLFEQNMKQWYDQSSWGFDLTSKEKELFHADSRYLMVSNDKDEMKGFVHFRFTMEEDWRTLYIYEIQLDVSIQRFGLGKRLMQLLELIGKTYQLDQLMLTVFKSNEMAMKFYTSKLKYQIDATSPSQCNDLTQSYEILSKPL